jgi:hypothetical protein
MTDAISAAEHADRRARLSEHVRTLGAAGYVVCDPTYITYLTGFRFLSTRSTSSTSSTDLRRRPASRCAFPGPVPDRPGWPQCRHQRRPQRAR